MVNLVKRPNWNLLGVNWMEIGAIVGGDYEIPSGLEIPMYIPSGIFTKIMNIFELKCTASSNHKIVLVHRKQQKARHFHFKARWPQFT
ncbi:hypothetical protein CDAR_190011 [Caerostris darwini]|uniref:Uncharacterized protein n=1 Tax=Caerostris darwini TaxID=1538125 RepID=A0AAV4QN58_9ARAC|nr:hypothetical protein CDAR_190011 [Caerostris darwini]